MVSDVAPFSRTAWVGGMGKWQLYERGRFRWFAGSGHPTIDACYLRPQTIPALRKRWTEEGRQHGGVIFVDEKTIPPADIGGLVRALIHLFKETGRWD